MDNDEDLDDILDFASNKLNVKNAFDVNAEFIKNIPSMLEDGKHEESWTKTSEIIAAGSKIYSCRVENIYKKVYNVLNGFHRTAGEQNENNENEENENKLDNQK